MPWFQHIDVALFRVINQGLQHPWLDAVIPWFSGNALFVPALLVTAALLLWKGGPRGRVFVAVLAATIALGDGLIINTLKHALQRPRPFLTLEDVHLLAGRGLSFSMPSSHTSTWFAATLVCFVYYRHTLRFMLPLACLVGFSRIYVGVHYPADVLAGAILGAGYAAAVLVLLQWTWSRLGPWAFAPWHAQVPDLTFQRGSVAPPGGTVMADPGQADRAWRMLAYIFIGAVFVLRLVYIGSSTIDLSEDEAYQWTWSKHLALSYFSKPPMIALLHWVGTHLWGDTQLGVRFMSPVLSAVMGLLVFRFAAAAFGVRPAFVLVVLAPTTPLLAVGSTLITVDPPLVFFWTCSMMAVWRAMQPGGGTWHWLLAGFCTGLAFLSKYSAVYQVICLALYFLLRPEARAHLRRPGPWLALGLILVSTIPVLVWNAANGWITVHHVAGNAGLDRAWKFTLRYFFEFLGAELALLNPVILAGAAWAAVQVWRERRRQTLLLYLACMGVPVFVGHIAYALHSRVQPNWIAPSVIPLLLLTVGYWSSRLPAQARLVRNALVVALVFNALLVTLMHDTRIIGKVAGRALPLDIDPLRRARGWRQTAAVIDNARRQLAAEGRPVFVIAHHYGMVGELSFYLDDARARVATDPLVFHITAETPRNQYYFWPGYRELRRGENAIYVRELDFGRRPARGRWDAWRAGDLSVPPPGKPGGPPPAVLLKEFGSVTDLGVHPVIFRGHTIRWLQLFACREGS